MTSVMTLHLAGATLAWLTRLRTNQRRDGHQALFDWPLFFGRSCILNLTYKQTNRLMLNEGS